MKAKMKNVPFGCVYVCVFVFMCLCLRVYACVFVFMCLCLRVYACVFVFVYLCLCVCVYVFMLVCILCFARKRISMEVSKASSDSLLVG